MATPIEDAINAALKPVEAPQVDPSGLPHVTHAGELEIVPGLRLKCFRLSDGRAVIAEESMRDFWRWMSAPTAAGQEAA